MQTGYSVLIPIFLDHCLVAGKLGITVEIFHNMMPTPRFAKTAFPWKEDDWVFALKKVLFHPVSFLSLKKVCEIFKKFLN